MTMRPFVRSLAASAAETPGAAASHDHDLRFAVPAKPCGPHGGMPAVRPAAAAPARSVRRDSVGSRERGSVMGVCLEKVLHSSLEEHAAPAVSGKCLRAGRGARNEDGRPEGRRRLTPRLQEERLLGDFLTADAAVDKAVEDGAGAQTHGAVGCRPWLRRRHRDPESVPDP